MNIRLNKPRPDAREFIDILLGRSKSRRVPLVEYIVDDVVMRPILVEILKREWVPWEPLAAASHGFLDNMVHFWHGMGYDIVRFELSLPFPHRAHAVTDTAPASEKERAWPDEHNGAIESWEDFERYPWPSVEAFDFGPLEHLNASLPDGMGLVSSHGGGVYEHLSWIMSFEGLCEALYDDPALVDAVAGRIGELMAGYYRNLLSLDRLVAVFPGDDMGYRNATMISPDALRRIILPWHRRFAAMAHGRGLPYFLHSCGRVTAIVEDLITDVRIDGKHSFEDVIVPVQEFQEMFGDRIAVLGGLDLNILSGGAPEDVRRRARFLIETCGPRARYAIGSGNSVPSYVPVENYLAMIGEAHRHDPRFHS